MTTSDDIDDSYLYDEERYKALNSFDDDEAYQDECAREDLAEED